jgi:hypothetical protein
VKLEIDLNEHVGEVFVRRTLPQPVFPLHRHQNILPGTFLRNKPILDTRAWTLQELLLSPRILWFGSAEMGWSCWSSTACECEPEQTFAHLKVDEEAANARSLRLSSSPTFLGGRSIDWPRTWCEIVHEFTLRDLTQSTDRLPAMSGLAAALQNHIQSAYLAGLWESELATQLLWASLWLAWGNNDTFSSPFEEDYAPSWTWASVPGQIRYHGKQDTRYDTPV